MTSEAGKGALRAPQGIVLDGIDDHDLEALRSRLRELDGFVEEIDPGEIIGDQSGRSWRFDVDDDVTITLSMSRTRTEVDVQRSEGGIAYCLDMERNWSGDPSEHGTDELHEAVRAWHSLMSLPRRRAKGTVLSSMRKLPWQIEIGGIVSALLSVHSEIDPSSILISVRPASIGTDPAIVQIPTGGTMLSPELVRHLLKDIPVEGQLVLQHDSMRYRLKDAGHEPNIQTRRIDPVEAMRVLAKLPQNLVGEKCIAKRFRRRR